MRCFLQYIFKFNLRTNQDQLRSENLRTFIFDPKFTGSYKKKTSVPILKAYWLNFKCCFQIVALENSNNFVWKSQNFINIMKKLNFGT